MLKKRTLALLLSLTMLLSLLTPTALATEGEEPGTTQEEVVKSNEDEQTDLNGATENGDAKDENQAPQQPATGDEEQPTGQDEPKNEDETKGEDGQPGEEPKQPEQTGDEQPTEPEQGEEAETSEEPEQGQDESQCTCGAAEGEEHAEDCPLYDLAAAYPPISGEASYADVKIIVNAPAGAFPAGTYLSVTPVVVEKDRMLESIQTALENTPFDTLEEGEEPFSVDIAFKTQDGVELQPREGYPVDVRFELPSEQLTADTMQVFHVSEGEDGLKADLVDVVPVEAAEPAPQTQTVELAATSFSIYAVASKNLNASATQINGNGNYTYDMIVNGPAGNGADGTTPGTTWFYWGNYYYGWGGSYGDESNYTWTVNDPDNTISWSVDKDANNTGNDVKKFPWITVKAIQPTPEGAADATVTLTYYSGRNQGSKTFKIHVNAQEFYIQDTIALDGCLTAVHDKKTIARCEWSRTDGVAIKDEAFADDAKIKVNVAVDRGGIDSDGVVKAYKVTAYDASGVVIGEINAEKAFEVPYGNEVLNGSFEQPVATEHNIVVANGYEKLYWMTTAPGTGQHLGQDIEIIRPENDYTNERNPGNYGVPSAKDGKQAAELNAEAAGALYQDVLTAPEADLSWSLYHRARFKDTNKRRADVKDTMYVVIASTKDAAPYDSKTALDEIIKDATKKGLTTSNSVASVLDGWKKDNKSYPEISYTIWMLTSDATDWHLYEGSYKVPKGQYLTRFFFAAGDTAANDDTIGNLIDGVSFSSEMGYTIEYWLDGERYKTVTQREEPFTVISADPSVLQYMESQHAVLVESTLNGKPGGTSFTLTNESNHLVLKFKTNSISVTKQVVIDGWDKLTEEQQKAIWPADGYQASFELYDGTNQVAIATVNVSMDSLSGVAEFANFTPQAGRTYTIRETSASELEGYGYTTTVSPDKVAITSNNLSGSFTVTNTYAISNLDLTIEKTGWQLIDENQSFIFHVTGGDGVDMDVTINFSDVNKTTGSVTITGLKPGNYTVTEKTDWSWRYTPNATSGNPQTIELTKDNNKVTFENSRPTVKWLNGCSWAVNNWNSSTPTKAPATPGSAN